MKVVGRFGGSFRWGWIRQRHPRGLQLGKGENLRCLTKKYEKYGKSGKMECKGKILKDIHEEKEVPNIPLDVFLFVIFFCDSRSQELKMLLRMAYG